ncbi:MULTISPECIES: DUF4280 domain-containing protein [Roseateles]|uniref:DUF4280 domain-containing protein n=1 Tax=Pelomonas caseinilytica TaxID=2906763 RepID=A0ABS8XAZ4_9BURK|nr:MULTISPECIES: DUF4280 domain-containing protein [unclassified Roseateles]MCE4538114.1 DUF4280 domain-containing protein [Pelomonas sp. P7]HEV6963858.1 DUF4280 domain-containing protein [Roseateles sp.]
MPQHVCSGAALACPFGAAPSQLTVLPKNKMKTSNQPAANIMDNVPNVNIAPFGACSSMGNPTVASATASATAAAMGVFTLTPMPCQPVFPAPWTPGAATVMLANMPVLNNTSTLNCAYGGVITITMPGQTTEMVP